jgi:hypothetical protein
MKAINPVLPALWLLLLRSVFHVTFGTTVTTKTLTLADGETAVVDFDLK